MATPSSAELPIQEATLDLIRWFIPILHRLPRQHRHGLGERLFTNLYEHLEQLALAPFLCAVAESGS
jgi:ribosomal protein S18 acetylase RimI-like enzyme